MSFTHYLVSYLGLNYCLNSSNIYRIHFPSTVLRTHCFEIFTLGVRGKVELFLCDNWQTTSTSRVFPARVNQIVHLMAENKFLDDPCDSSTNKTQTTNSSSDFCSVWIFVLFFCFVFKLILKGYLSLCQMTHVFSWYSWGTFLHWNTSDSIKVQQAPFLREN